MLLMIFNMFTALNTLFLHAFFSLCESYVTERLAYKQAALTRSVYCKLDCCNSLLYKSSLSM